MRRKIFICLFIIFVPFTLFMVKKLHLHNFWKGEKEFKELTKKTSPLKSGSDKSSNFIYIAHAGGGYNGKSYLNNLEAINNSYSLGLSFFEIDFHYTSDSVVVLSHDFVKLKAREFLLDKTEGTHLTLQNLMMWMKDKEICLVTDIKTDNIKILQSILNSYPELSNKIIPQAYTISEIATIRAMGFRNVIFTNYMANYPNSIIKKLATTDFLFGITLPYDINFRILEYFNDFKKMPTSIFTHTINKLDVVSELKMSGCSGIYTDFLVTSTHK